MRNKVVLGLVALLLISIPITIALVHNNQELRSRAGGTTKLSFLPETTSTTPLTKAVGDAIDLDVMVDPGTNLVTFVRVQVQYDPTKLKLQATTPFTQNLTDFPLAVEGPVLGTGTLAQSISVGSDPTKAVKTVTKAGTLHFTAIGPTTTTPTQVSFTSLSQALSSGASDQAAENVVATKTSAYISITGDAVPSASPSGTTLSFDLLLHGIGSAGDNPNPTGNSLSNKNPLHAERNLDIQILNSNNEIVASVAGTVLYSSPSGTFKGNVDLGKDFVTGDYLIKLQSDRYLRKLVSGVQHITNMQNTIIPQTALVAGNTNQDNTLNVLDYNAFLDCGYGALNPLPITDPASVYKQSACQVHTPTILIDNDDNGIINSADYNLFLRELSVQAGD